MFGWRVWLVDCVGTFGGWVYGACYCFWFGGRISLLVPCLAVAGLVCWVEFAGCQVVHMGVPQFALDVIVGFVYFLTVDR